MKTRIKALREDRGWTVAALAKRAGISASYVSEIENHRKTVNGRKIDALARAFGVRPVDLIDESSVDPETVDHIRRLERLTEADRQAVFRHAIALDPGDGEAEEPTD
jgi:transcriptional regulator with XRE-family HTH domain